MSILEIILYSALGIGVTLYVIYTIIKWKKSKKKKIKRGGLRYGNDPKEEDEEDEE